MCEGEKKGSRRVELSGVIWESKRDKLGSWSALAGLSMRQSGDDQQWRVCDRTALWRHVRLSNCAIIIGELLEESIELTHHLDPWMSGLSVVKDRVAYVGLYGSSFHA